MKRKAQSEIVGFALIIIIVAVLILVFLSISMKKNNDDITKSYEVESFVQSMLYYTSSCEEKYSGDYVKIMELLVMCKENKFCYDSKKSCEVLEKELLSIIDSSWKVGEDWPTKGYNLNITSEGEELLGITKGNRTSSNKGSEQKLSQDLAIRLIIYN